MGKSTEPQGKILLGVSDNQKDWVPECWLGEPRDNKNNKKEIVCYLNYVRETPLRIVEPKTRITDTGVSVHYMKPIKIHEK